MIGHKTKKYAHLLNVSLYLIQSLLPHPKFGGENILWRGSWTAPITSLTIFSPIKQCKSIFTSPFSSTFYLTKVNFILSVRFSLNMYLLQIQNQSPWLKKMKPNSFSLELFEEKTSYTKGTKANFGWLICPFIAVGYRTRIFEYSTNIETKNDEGSLQYYSSLSKIPA